MRSRILIVAPYALWAPHHETELELAETHLRDGDEVTWLECLRALPFCEPNPEHKLGACLTCAARGRHGRSLLLKAVNVVSIPEVSQEDRASLAKQIEEMKDIDQLREFTIEGFDIGLGVVSSLVSVLEDPSPDLSDPPVRRLAGKIAESGLRTFLGVKHLLSAQRFDLVYVFNGRFAASRGALRAGRSLGVHCLVHERGATPQKYLIRENAIAHDLRQLRLEVDALWESAGERGGRLNAAYVFEQMRGGASIGWLAHTNRQRPDSLPESWDRGRRNVVFFASSEDEYQELEAEWRWRVFPSQVEGIRHLRQLLGGDQRVKFWVRMHPNQGRMPRRSLEPYFDLAKEKDLEVIEPASPVSSYALIDAADCVVSFGSTIGIEAAYWGRPSVLLAQASFRGLGSTYDAQSVGEAIAWLSDPSLPPKPKIGAAKYGNYLMTFGRPFVHFESSDLFSGKFRGQKVNAGMASRLWFALSWTMRALRRYLRRMERTV